MKKIILLIAFSVVSLPCFSGDAAKGKSLYLAKCVSCHGANGEGNVKELAPRIAGQLEFYILSSLKAFKAGTRSNPKMMEFIEGMTNSDFENLSSYITTLK
jgi:cytochrome c553